MSESMRRRLDALGRCARTVAADQLTARLAVLDDDARRELVESAPGEDAPDGAHDRWLEAHGILPALVDRVVAGLDEPEAERAFEEIFDRAGIGG